MARSLRKDLTGKKFGMLTVISLNGRDKGGRALWLCKCACGESIVADGYNLQSGHTSSCGCLKYTEKYGKNIIGKRFGRLIAIRQFVNNKYTMVECICDCGNKTFVHRSSLVVGTTSSCGCYQKEVLLKASTTHGMSGTRIHSIWSDMRSRCNLITNQNYYRYGGRGIKVHEEWEGESGFNHFYEWSMKNGYTDKLTIDRIDNNSSYCPDNCRWTDMETQCNNRRNSRFLEYNGEIKTLAQWVKYLNLKYSRTYNRIYELGWTVKEAFEEPFYHASYNPA